MIRKGVTFPETEGLRCRSVKEHIFEVLASCVHGRFVQGEISCKILRLASSEVHKN